MKPRIAALIALALITAAFPLAGKGAAQATDLADVPAGRETEAVVLTGAGFPEWATLGDVALKANSLEGAQCLLEEEGGPGGIPDSPVTDDEPCSTNTYEDPDFQTSDFVPPANATPINKLLGYRWNGTKFEQIPFQVDEMFIHYLSNNRSGFAFYSETDQHTTYAFDREGFRWTADKRSDPDWRGDPELARCTAHPASPVAEDPVPGLDTDDELVFMARDARASAPENAPLPPGIEDSYKVSIEDPTNPGVPLAVYIMKAKDEGPEPAFDATNGYVRYQRDADEDENLFFFSESSFENYGRALEGFVYDPATGRCREPFDHDRDSRTPDTDQVQRRPGDEATITTPRYRFRYEGRWLMTQLNISSTPEGDWNYGPDVIDQWKARAFQQRPGGETPCCGYEEEVNNWGGSSILMGELSGPVRTIRETWGADSGTNVVRREIFYRDEIRFISFLRVHVIPPADGIYSQWDYNAGVMTRYYNPLNPEGVAIDGCNDDAGNSRVYANNDGLAFDPDGKGPHPCGEQDQASIGREGSTCDGDCIDNDIDIPDPIFSGVNAGSNWEEISGPHGTLVSRYQLHKATPGSAHSVVTVPYYRDDACFDDGTGTNPGPHMDARDVDGDEESDANYTAEDGTRQPRTCWDSAPAPTPPLSDPRYWQASIGTHGVHIELIADSDNAHTTLPLTEIDGDQRMVILPGEQPNVGERYGRQPEKPLVVAANPEQRSQSPDPEPTETVTPSPSETTASPSPTETTPATRGTTVTITGDRGGQYSDRATLAARLTDTESGEPLAGKDLTIELTGADGSTSWTTTTNEDGTAAETITLDRVPGDYQLSVRYAGEEDTYLASADQTAFTIDKEDTTLRLVVDSKGSRRTLIATLTDADSSAGIADRTIGFSADGTSLGASETDGAGRAQLAPPPAYRNGHHDYRASFDGDDYYVSSSDSQQT